MENQSGQRTKKSSIKGSKAVKAKRAEDEARRREALKEALRDKLELEKRALQVVERLLADSVPEDFLVDCANFITPANYKDVIEERFIVKLCGYPICQNKLGKIPTQQFKISTKTNKVYDITERKCFCSNFCYKASKEFELKISTIPLWLRHHERPPQITLMRKGDGGSSGAEVRIAERRLQEVDIEAPAMAADPSPDPRRPAELRAREDPRGDDSDDDDGEQEQEQEQGFVSSMVTVKRPGPPRVHWGELPGPTADRGQKQIQKKENMTKEEEEEEEEGGLHQQGEAENVVKESGEHGGEAGVCETEEESGLGETLNIDAAHARLPSVQQTPGEEQQEVREKGEQRSVDLHSAEVEEAAALLNSCRIAEQVKDAAPARAATGPLHGGQQQEEHCPPVVNPPADAAANATESEPQTPDRLPNTAACPPAPGLDVTQVGMSKRGAAGLRGLLLLHGGAVAAPPPSSFRRNLLESLRRTLGEWRSHETRAFLYGADRAPLLGSREEEEKEEGAGEEELDEDDFEMEEEQEAVVEGGGGARGRPRAPAPDYDTLRRQTQEQELLVREFYQGSRVLPGDTEKPAGHAQASAQGRETRDPILPLVDSQAQTLIQKRITVDKLTRSLRNIVGPLGLTMTDVSTDLNSLVRTFRLTNTNIIHKAPEWTLISVVLLHLLTEVSAAVREALGSPESVQRVNALMQELGLQRPDLLTLLQLFRSPMH